MSVSNLVYPTSVLLCIQYVWIFSGGILCDLLGDGTCGSPAAIDTGGSILRNGHNFVVHHISTAVTQAGAIGFKLNYSQLPCNGAASGGQNP